MKPAWLALIAATGIPVLAACSNGSDPARDASTAPDALADAAPDVSADADPWHGAGVRCAEAFAGDPCSHVGDRCSRLYRTCGPPPSPSSSLACSCASDHVWWCYEFEACGWHDGGAEGGAPDVPEIPSDAGDGGTSPWTGVAGVVNCGGASCESAGHECCVASQGLDAVCAARGASVGPDCAICDGPEDCAAGESCCMGSITACAPTADCLADTPNSAVVCLSDQDCPAAAPHCCGVPGDPLQPSYGRHLCSPSVCGM